jgi:antitoxin VapB
VYTEVFVAKDRLSEERRKFEYERLSGSMPWMKNIDQERHKTRIFKSGNSLAVRIPAGTKLAAGMEMELIVEDGKFLSYEPVELPKRKFNIAKVAGSAKGLKFVQREDRSFEPRPSSLDEQPRDE